MHHHIAAKSRLPRVRFTVQQATVYTKVPVRASNTAVSVLEKRSGVHHAGAGFFSEEDIMPSTPHSLSATLASPRETALPISLSYSWFPVEGLRLILTFLACIGVLTAACLAQSSSTPADRSTPDPNKIVRDASYNEMHASNQGHTFRYRTHSIDGDKTTLKEIVETHDGDIKRLLESGDKPLSASANQDELDRLDKLRANPDEQAKRHKRSQAESSRDNEMLRVLPDAFTYTYEGMVPGPNGPCYRLKFEPNPSFQPPDRQAEVYHGMAGELWVDQAQQRMVRFDAHLISDVDFGWGIVGQLFKGGTILVEQQDVGEHHWENTYTRLHLSGKILLVKPLDIDTTDTSSDFHPIPDNGYQAAIDYLKTIPLPQK